MQQIKNNSTKSTLIQIVLIYLLYDSTAVNTLNIYIKNEVNS